MAWEENSCISLNMQLIAILSRIGVLYVLPESKAPVEHDVIEIAIMPNAITVVIFLFIYSSVFWLYLSESSAKVLRFLDIQQGITLQLQGVFPIVYVKSRIYVYKYTCVRVDV